MPWIGLWALRHISVGEVYRHNEDRVRVLTTAAMADEILFDENMDSEVLKLKQKVEVSNQDLLASLLGSRTEYQTEFGQRKLAVDPETNQITFNFSNLVREVLGYEEGGVSSDEFVAREELMALQKGRSNGEYPNPRLCRWCRHLTKPLKYREKNLISLPIGVWFRPMEIGRWSCTAEENAPSSPQTREICMQTSKDWTKRRVRSLCTNGS